jgi:hypothetical protein
VAALAAANTRTIAIATHWNRFDASGDLPLAGRGGKPPAASSLNAATGATIRLDARPGFEPPAVIKIC